MNFFSYLRVETGRLLRARRTWLIILLTALCPLAGFSLYRKVGGTTASIVLGNPILAGGLGGAVLFAVFTLLELDRVHKAHTDALTDSIVSPFLLGIVKLLSMFAASLLAVLLTAAAYLPYTVFRMRGAFILGDYLLCYCLFMLCSMWLGILAISAFYQIVRRVDLSFVLFAILVFFSLSTWCSKEYLLRWINPLVPILSDDFSNGMMFRLTGYSRLFWFSVLLGVWLFSLLCVREHGKGLFGSLFLHCRKVPVPVLTALLLGCGVYLYLSEPYIDHSPLKTFDQGTNVSDISVGGGDYDPYAKENPALTLVGYSMKASIDPKHHNLSDRIDYQVKNSSGREQECILQLRPGLTIKSVTANGRPVPFTDRNNDHDQMKDIVCQLPSDKKIDLLFSYSGYPKIWNESRDYFMGSEIESNYVQLGGTELFPVVNTASSKEKLTEKEREVTLPADFAVISNGPSAQVLRQNSDGTKTWKLNSSFLLAGDYTNDDLSGSGMPVSFYYSRNSRQQMQQLGVPKLLQDTIGYCAQKYGTLPYATKKQPLVIAEETAYVQGGGLLGNVSTMGELIFSPELVDPQKGASHAEVLAHEIVHQWWGFSAQCRDEKNPNWTDEGVTVYTTYRLMKELKGEAYAQKNYVDVWNQQHKDLNNNFYLRHPEYLKILPKKYNNVLEGEIASTNTYSNMALKIYKAAGLVGGEDKMDSILHELYQKSMATHKPVTWQNFLSACGLKEAQLNFD